MDLKVSGALASNFSSYTLWRMTAWGQTITHLPHWIHNFSSHTGISSAILRFSHCVVPVGKVPSTGKAETGMLSPFAPMISPSTSRTNSGASLGTESRREVLDVITDGTFTSYRF